MIDLLVATTEAESPKTLYYVAGSALALFAIGISIVGFMRPSFPSSSLQSRAVIAVAIALTAFAMLSVLITS